MCKYRHRLRDSVKNLVLNYSSYLDIPEEYEKNLIDKIAGTLLDQCQKMEAK